LELDIKNAATKMGYLLEFTAFIVHGGVLNNVIGHHCSESHPAPLPDHPKSSIGCIGA
jgi:hypothetical protein